MLAPPWIWVGAIAGSRFAFKHNAQSLRTFSYSVGAPILVGSDAGRFLSHSSLSGCCASKRDSDVAIATIATVPSYFPLPIFTNCKPPPLVVLDCQLVLCFDGRCPESSCTKRFYSCSACRHQHARMWGGPYSRHRYMYLTANTPKTTPHPDRAPF